MLEEGEKWPGWALSPENAHESQEQVLRSLCSKGPSHSLPQPQGNLGGVSALQRPPQAPVQLRGRMLPSVFPKPQGPPPAHLHSSVPPTQEHLRGQAQDHNCRDTRLGLFDPSPRPTAPQADHCSTQQVWRRGPPPRPPSPTSPLRRPSSPRVLSRVCGPAFLGVLAHL